MTRALTLPAYHVTQATDLIARMQPDLGSEGMISALTAIDHVGIAVDDLEAAVEHYGRTLGVKPVLRERVVDQGVEEVLFAAGGSFIQLLGALGPDTPVGRFLATNGPGIHHVAYRVSDVASTLEQLRREDVRLIDEVRARLAQHAHRVRPPEVDGRRPRGARPGGLRPRDPPIASASSSR